MILQRQESDSLSEAKFKLQGFPEEAAVASALERFYKDQPGAPRSFLIHNMFDELIFKGSVSAEGGVSELGSIERPRERLFKPAV